MTHAASAPAPASVDIYVDGSYQDGRTGYGAVILHEGRVLHELCGPVPPEQVGGTRQVAGELMAVGHAVRWLKQQGIGAARVFHDYEGVGAWAEGRWKAKQDLTQRYAAFVKQCGVRLQFFKVKAHTGDAWNERADVLARHGAAVAQLDTQDVERVQELEAMAQQVELKLIQQGLRVENLGVHNRMFVRLRVAGPGGQANWDLYHGSPDNWTARYTGAAAPDIRRVIDKVWDAAKPRYVQG